MDRITHIVEFVRQRLSDVEFTKQNTRVPAEKSLNGTDEPVWDDLSLSSGYPGVSLAYVGGAAVDRRRLMQAHAYLATAATAVNEQARSGRATAAGMYMGSGALAFATLAAHQAGGGYAKALESLDNAVAREARRIAESISASPMISLADIDITRGLSGMGRYLLARYRTDDLRTVLSYFVELSKDREIDGVQVPGWWASGGPILGPAPDEFQSGHLNLGLAHGICGPLALLSLAHRAGITVEGHEAAIEYIVRTILDQALTDEWGMYWPNVVSLDDWRARADTDMTGKRARTRPSWCYGVAGISRSLQLAAHALGRAEWRAVAKKSLISLTAIPLDDLGFDDASFCHGWAGLLHIVRMCNQEYADERLEKYTHALARRVVELFDEDAPFAFRGSMLNVPMGVDSSGLLEGATGIALALELYAEGAPAGAGLDVCTLMG